MRHSKLGYVWYYFAFAAILCAMAIIPSAQADGADAELHDVEVTASPSSQGRGGAIFVDAAVNFYGGCCYHLYANDVTATLLAPEEIEITAGPIPEEYKEVDAQPGGAATVVHFEWTVKGSAEGLYNLSVVVDTKNCGSVENTVIIEIVEGCIISPPVLYPKQASVDRENIISITASTSLEGRYVKNVTLFYVMDKEYAEGTPRNDTVYLDNGKEKKGTALAMDQDPHSPEQWMCKLESRLKGEMNFWFVARDDLGKNTTSSLYSIDVIDQQEIDSITGMMFWGLILGTIFGFIFIFVVQEFYAQKKASKMNVLQLRAEKEGEEKVSRARDIIIIGLLIISLLIIALALFLGLFEEIVKLALG